MKDEQKPNNFKNYLNYHMGFWQTGTAPQEAQKIHQAICRYHQEKSTVPRQQIEKGHFGFNYQGEGLGGHEHFFFKPTGDDNSAVAHFIPISHEYAPPKAGLIDWLNFTLSKSRFLCGDEDAVSCLSCELEALLGYGVTLKEGKGRNGYAESYVLGNNWGFVCIGGKSQKETVLVMINGEGCTAARQGWQHHVYAWSHQVNRFHITRVDVAYDCFEQEYTVDRAVEDYDKGLFNAGGRTPSIEQRGNWRVPDDEYGRTVYIGKRRNGKYCRIYEKGKQLGDPNSQWVRIECEWHNKNRDIPKDVLLEPGQYLAGAYCAFMWLNQKQSKMKTCQKKHHIIYEKAIENIRKQYGAVIWEMVERGETPEDIIKKVIREPSKPFNRFAVPHWKEAKKPIHKG